MTWYTVYELATDLPISVATEVADPLPDGLGVIESAEEPTGRWDLQTHTWGPPPTLEASDGTATAEDAPAGDAEDAAAPTPEAAGPPGPTGEGDGAGDSEEGAAGPDADGQATPVG